VGVHAIICCCAQHVSLWLFIQQSVVQEVYTQEVYTQVVYTQEVYTQEVYTQVVYTQVGRRLEACCQCGMSLAGLLVLCCRIADVKPAAAEVVDQGLCALILGVGLSWHQLACPGLSWHQLACPGMSWHVLACPGMSWHVLACPGMSWHVLAW
jgi:hypothetical protein